MFNNIKNSIILKVCLLLLLSSAFTAEASEDKVVAIVNNDVITQEELDSYESFLQMQMTPEEWSKYGADGSKALESLIEDRILPQAAKKRDIQIEERAVEQKIKRLKSGFGSEDEFIQALRFQGISLSELRKRIQEQLLITRFISYEIRSRVIISPKEVTEYYQGHKEEFKTPEQVLVDSIFLEDKEAAADVYRKLKSGQDFMALQEQYSMKESLGLVGRGQLRETIETVIFDLKIGDFSEPFQTDEGYYIFLVRSKEAQSYKDLIEVQAQISDLISNMKYNMRLKSRIDELKQKAYISIKI